LLGCDVSDTGMSSVMPVRDFNLVFILCRLIDLIIKTTVPKIINKSTAMPAMSLTRNEEEGVIVFTVVDNLATVIKTTFVFLVVDGGIVVESVRIVVLGSDRQKKRISYTHRISQTTCNR